ncbi:MAG: hypothetical protein JSS91_08535 [Bacteroidetes bacterium]|nr:hypothetical protein [Bacteroidota bacterium]
MKRVKLSLSIFLIPVLAGLAFLISSCSENSTEPSFQTDDDYIRSIAAGSSFSSNADDDDNLFFTDDMDFESDGAVYNNEGIASPLDSILKWGRRITGKNINVNITTIGDTLKNATVTKTLSGNFIIIGYSSGILDTTVKPFTQEQKRTITFRRVNRKSNPGMNWRVYQYSAIDGETKTPQTGKDNIVMNKVEYYKNNNLVLTLNGPDFTANIFTSRYFGNNTLIDVSRGDQIKIKVYLTSNQNDTDIVAYHWARNSFGFHREPFVMTSQVPNGNNFDRTYEKTFNIYPNHRFGMHNGYISSNTRSSLFDNNTSLFSSTFMGLPYRVR